MHFLFSGHFPAFRAKEEFIVFCYFIYMYVLTLNRHLDGVFRGHDSSSFVSISPYP